MTQFLSFLWDKPAMQLIDSVGGIFKKVPHLPKGLVDFFVTIAPWLAGIGGILSVLNGANAVFGLRNMTFLSQVILALDPTYLMISGVLWIVAGLLMLMAFSPLRTKFERGWVLLFWAAVLSLINSAIAVFYGYNTIVFALVGAAINFYVLFEMRGSYKKAKSK